MQDDWRQVRQRHTVPPEGSQLRFKDYAREHFKEAISSRKGIHKAIKRGEFLLDGQPAETGTWLQPGQVIELLHSEEPTGKIFPLKLEVLFEDEHLAVINKPSGYPVSGNYFKTIANALPANLAASPEEDALPLPLPVHRLDRQTSGLLIAAKTHHAQVRLGTLFEERQIRKRYRAIVIGNLDEGGVIESELEGKQSVTRYEPVSQSHSLRDRWLTRVDLFPETGRTHQLRIHMAGLGHPILGDQIYGTEGSILRGRGLFLSSVELHFPHPISGEAIKPAMDEPAKFDRMIQREEQRWKRAAN